MNVNYTTVGYVNRTVNIVGDPFPVNELQAIIIREMPKSKSAKEIGKMTGKSFRTIQNIQQLLREETGCASEKDFIAHCVSENLPQKFANVVMP